MSPRARQTLSPLLRRRARSVHSSLHRACAKRRAFSSSDSRTRRRGSLDPAAGAAPVRRSLQQSYCGARARGCGLQPVDHGRGRRRGQRARTPRAPSSPFSGKELATPRRLRARCTRTEHGNRRQKLIKAGSRAGALPGHVVATNKTAQRSQVVRARATLRRRSLALPRAASAAVHRGVAL